MKPLYWRLLVSIDQLLNVVISLVPSLKRKGFGFPDETISSVVGKRYYFDNDRSLFIVTIYKLVEKFDKGHFKRFVECDEGLTRGEECPIEKI